VAAGLLAPARPAHSQDTQYWTHAYGTRSQLLGGCTVGSILDLSSTFYNPGVTALTSETNLLLGGGSLYLTQLQIGDTPADRSTGTERVAASPSLFALKFQDPEGKGTAWSFNYLTRFDVDYELRTATAEPYSPDTTLPRLAGELLLARRLGEIWAGVGTSRPVGAFGMGAQLYLAHRTERIRSDLLLQQSVGDSVQLLTTTSDIRFYHTRVLAKLGAAYRGARGSAGLAVTTPGLKLLGSGEVFANASAENVDVDGDGMPDEFLVSSAQEDLSVHYKSPLSVAFGASRVFDRFTLHAAAEWFAGVPEYDVMEADSLVSQTSGASVPLLYETASRSIVNFGLGVEWRVGQTGGLFLAARTDQSTYVQIEESLYTNFSSWDIGHVSLGGAFRIGTLDLTLGAGYSFGAGAIFNPNPLPSGRDASTQAVVNQDLPITYRGVNGILGFGLPF
jgi:hypothetical protein